MAVRLIAFSLLSVLGLTALSTAAFASEDYGLSSSQKGNALQGLTQYADTAQASSKSKSNTKSKPEKPTRLIRVCEYDKKKREKKCRLKPRPVTPD